jgi:serine/threonine protein kinase
MNDRVGQRLGNYQLVRLLGKGGFAEVYLGEHVRLRTQAAIKVLLTRLPGEEEIASFQKEAETIAHLNHPHIVRVLDFDVFETTPFLVMDYAPGGTLRQRHPKGTQLSPEEILPYVKQIADALHYAHDKKLIHRDIKPENLLVGEGGRILLSDFSIALISQSSRYQNTQEVVGTAAYMAPEQLQGKPQRASDQYALGIVIYEWLTGSHPFHGSFTELYSQQMFVAPRPLREQVSTLSLGLENVILTALEKDPKARFGNIRAFATAFEAACQEAGLLSAPTTRYAAPQTPPQPLDASTLAPSQPTPADAVGLPPTIVSPPSNTSTSDQSAAFGPPHVSAPHPALPDTFSFTTPSPAASVKAEEPKHPKRRITRRKMAVAGGALVGLAAVGMSVPTLIIPGIRAATFQQEVTTSDIVPRIHLGTNYDRIFGGVVGEKDTFSKGETVFVVFDSQAILPTELGVKLFLSGILGYELSGSFQFSSVSPFRFVSSTRIDDPGIYKWEIDYVGTPQASITFLVG